jgi:hypothetical protein
MTPRPARSRKSRTTPVAFKAKLEKEQQLRRIGAAQAFKPCGHS